MSTIKAELQPTFTWGRGSPTEQAGHAIKHELNFGFNLQSLSENWQRLKKLGGDAVNTIDLASTLSPSENYTHDIRLALQQDFEKMQSKVADQPYPAYWEYRLSTEPEAIFIDCLKAGLYGEQAEAVQKEIEQCWQKVHTPNVFDRSNWTCKLEENGAFRQQIVEIVERDAPLWQKQLDIVQAFVEHLGNEKEFSDRTFGLKPLYIAALTLKHFDSLEPSAAKSKRGSTLPASNGFD